MNIEYIYKQLAKAYKTNNVELFNELNEKYKIGLESIDDVELIENRPTIDLSKYFKNWDAEYYKNYTTSRSIVNIEPLHKHELDSEGFKITSYSMVIYKVLNALKDNPNLDEVLNQVEINMDASIAKDFLISKELIKPKAFNKRELRKKYSKYSEDELKKELKSYSLDIDGNKKTLIKRLIDYDLTHKDKSGNYTITQYGNHRLNGVSWVSLYEGYLEYFDFIDFENYMQDYDTGSVMQNSFNYLEENLEMAYDDRDFYRLHDVFCSYAMLNLNEQDFEKSLEWELKVFILKLNPVFLDKEDLNKTEAIEYPNINNIMVLSVLAEIEDLTDIFTKCWSNMELGEMLIDEKSALDYLNKAFDCEDIEKLNDEYVDKYFN